MVRIRPKENTRRRLSAWVLVGVSDAVWNPVGIVVLGIAAVAAGSVALAGFGPDSLIRSVPRWWCGNCPAPGRLGSGAL